MIMGFFPVQKLQFMKNKQSLSSAEAQASNEAVVFVHLCSLPEAEKKIITTKNKSGVSKTMQDDCSVYTSYEKRDDEDQTSALEIFLILFFFPWMRPRNILIFVSLVVVAVHYGKINATRVQRSLRHTSFSKRVSVSQFAR